MALVAYDYSDTDSENDSDDGNKETVANVLFSSLPAPKQIIVEVEEECDDILLKNQKNNQTTKSNSKNNTVKIVLPALTNYNSDEEETPKKIPKVAPVKATGLFALLPSPKCAPAEKNSKFDAAVVKRKNLIPRTVKSNLAKPVKRKTDSDDEDEKEGQHFFFNNFTESKITPTTSSSSINIEIDSAKPVKDMTSKTNQYFADLLSSTQQSSTGNVETEEENDILNETAVKELCGKQHKRMKKDDVRMVDINASDILDPREWRTKALTQEAPTATVKKGDEPSLQSRRKHQITYLAYQAKMNEQELKNQWALNRMTRKQTQAKYGF